MKNVNNKSQIIVIKKTETKSVSKTIAKKIKIPIFAKDRYGYIMACLDGKTTIQIGLNGVISNAENTHSIETHNYVSPSFIDEKTEILTREAFF